ncbi:nuclear factor 7, brain-like isoform X2 [Trematomus bernacchii]|uniref:nuclear factor 7, brain-like isoform X2 n=1 Tax=Trematomus bernacchii TaxID=40690 RepID=UPI00146D591A|nr:nuclear factor 7, brain-like isoform X2 [Trematomus bernacchii]
MAKIKEELWYILQHLKEDELKHFKWFLEQENLLEGFSGIPVSRLETADRKDTVDLMVQNYQDDGARKVAMNILKKINRNDLVQKFQNFELKGQPTEIQRERNGSVVKKRWVKLLFLTLIVIIVCYAWLGKNCNLGQQSAVEVTLDPDTTHPKLGLGLLHLRDSSHNFWWGPKMGSCGPEDKYAANENNPVDLSFNRTLEKVGVFVDYDEGLVSFYNVDSADLLYSFTGCSFTEKLLPYFSPCTTDGGLNSAPLIITPVDRPLNQTKDFGGPEQCERKTAMPMKVLQSAVEVTLDPDTAHPYLVLYDDGKQVYLSDEEKILPDNPERFSRCVNLLGKQSFSSGRFYFEVQVKGKTAWTVGVAKQSIKRKGRIILSPKDGFWTVWLRHGDEYAANENNPVDLPFNRLLEKVGVFVDYDEGLVSFKDFKDGAHCVR